MTEGKGIKYLAECITEAVNADADPNSAGYARVMEMPMPDGSCATVLIVSGAQHDKLCEIVETSFSGARRFRPC